jgi:hypothetical protein
MCNLLLAADTVLVTRSLFICNLPNHLVFETCETVVLLPVEREAKINLLLRQFYGILLLSVPRLVEQKGPKAKKVRHLHE